MGRAISVELHPEKRYSEDRVSYAKGALKHSNMETTTAVRASQPALHYDPERPREGLTYGATTGNRTLPSDSEAVCSGESGSARYDENSGRLASAATETPVAASLRRMTKAEAKDGPDGLSEQPQSEFRGEDAMYDGDTGKLHGQGQTTPSGMEYDNGATCASGKSNLASHAASRTTNSMAAVQTNAIHDEQADQRHNQQISESSGMVSDGQSTAQAMMPANNQFAYDNLSARQPVGLTVQRTEGRTGRTKGSCGCTPNPTRVGNGTNQRH